MNKRIEYIDTMRGFAMIMVVIYHITYGFFESENIITTMVNNQLELPLFFMISGFFASDRWNDSYFKTIRTKFETLVIPALLMLLMYCWIKDISYFSALCKMLKDGYWFTLVLFEFVVIFATTNAVIRLMKINDNLKNLLHTSVGVILIFIGSYAEKFNSSYPVLNMFTVTYFGLYFYFIIGYVLFKQQDSFFNALKNKPIATGGGILLYIFLDIVRYKYECFSFLGKGTALALTLHTTLGVLIVWLAFKKYSNCDKTNTINRFLYTVGNRSLDVYFIHYFLLPAPTDAISKLFISDMPFIEYCTAIAIAVLLTLASLGIGAVLRLSPVSSKLLLGRK